MFSNIFGSVVIQEELRQSIIKSTLQSKTNIVIDLIQKHNINVNNFYLNDDCGQNLLHLCVRTKNYDLARYLINKKIDKQKRNMFNETPYDIALKNGDLKMIEVLLESNDNSYMQIENKRLSDRVIELENNNKIYTDTNKELIQKNSRLHIDLDNERRGLKRMKDDNELLVSENRRIKTENCQLKLDNKTLGDTIKTLRDSMKK